VIFRSEDEQLIRHELIKALRNFKLSPVSPLPSSNHHESFLNNETLFKKNHGTGWPDNESTKTWRMQTEG
jgi:hypothetical protein